MTRRLARLSLTALVVAGIAQALAGAMVPAKAVAAQWLLARAFDRSLVTHRAERPWGWADMAPAARLSVPRLGVERIVLDSGSGQAMAFGPTLLPGGARPGGTGVVVIAAHRDTHFGFLRNVRAGDVVRLQGIDGAAHRYRVTGAEVVRWNRFGMPTDAGRQLALTTCYPFGMLRHGPLRYVVHAVEVDAGVS